jgi:hypothetical protein
MRTAASREMTMVQKRKLDFFADFAFTRRAEYFTAAAGSFSRAIFDDHLHTPV